MAYKKRWRSEHAQSEHEEIERLIPKAKNGNKRARKTLMQKYRVRVFSQKEIDQYAHK